MTDPVVVGVDGSPASREAAEHAAAAAMRRSAPLLLVHGYLHPFRYGVAFDPYALELPPPADDAVKMLDGMAADLRHKWPDLHIETRQTPGGPAATLVDLSQHAQLVVVGSRGHGGFTGLLLGSVSAQVAAHAQCPVLVVRPVAGPPPAGPVLVGVDGSPGSATALSLAADEAARRGSPLAVVHAWSVDPVAERRETYVDTEDASRGAAEALLADAAAEARQGHPDLTVEERLVHALDPERVLIEASEAASLVVVGSRGRGGFTGMLLGSVSQALIHHGRCPVLVAHRHRREG